SFARTVLHLHRRAADDRAHAACARVAFGPYRASTAHVGSCLWIAVSVFDPAASVCCASARSPPPNGSSLSNGVDCRVCLLYSVSHYRPSPGQGDWSRVCHIGPAVSLFLRPAV